MAEFPPGEWGTYGQWASALITGAAFSATFYVIRRDAKVRRFAQARKVGFYYQAMRPEDRETDYSHPYRLFLRNLSDEPLYDVNFRIYKDDTYLAQYELRPVLLPGDELTTTYDGQPKLKEVAANFRDNSGVEWMRTLDGRHKEINNRRAPNSSQKMI